MTKRTKQFLKQQRNPWRTLEQRIVDNRRKVKWRRIQNRIRLQHYRYEDEGKLDKALALLERIRKEMLRPCPRCGAT